MDLTFSFYFGKSNADRSAQMTHPSPSSPRGRDAHRPAVGAALVSAVLASVGLAARAEGEPPAAPAGAASAAAADTQTVTVTATRRREPARDVPVQVNALSAESLERAGAASLRDYVGGLPGVDVKTANGPGLGQVSIRGVTTGDQTIATVGVYVDDVAFGSSSAFAAGSTMALDMALLDLDHVEVLRGPQGTLYGAGAMGGLLKYVTKEPDSYELSGKASLSVGSTRRGGVSHVESGVVNVPLKEGVAAMRVALFRDHQGGYVDAVGAAAGRDVNSGDSTGGRVSLLVEPLAKLRVRLTAVKQEIDRRGNDVVDYDISTGRPVEGDLARRLAIREPYHIDIGLLSADVEYDMGWARLNSITSAQQEKTRNRLDAGFYDGPLTEAVGAPVSGSRLDSFPGVRKHTQEFRLTSAPGALEWLGGLYVDSETGRNSQVLSTTGVADQSSLDVITIAQPSEYHEAAAYGDVTWNLGKDWALTAGARVARNRQRYQQVTGGVPGELARSAETSRTYLATVRYALTPASNVYFRAASGYRPGGPNATALDSAGNPIPGAPTSFKSDSLWSYELGYKGDLLDKRLSLEAAAYDIEWKDIQQPVALGSGTIIGNGGRARVQGLELFTRYRLGQAWTLDGSLSAIDAKLTEDAPALGPSGSRLPNSARYAATIGATASFALAQRPAYAGANVRYVGERNAGFDNPESSQPNFRMPGYTLVDLQGGVALGRVDLGLYVRNLFDKRAIVGADAALVAFGSPLHATVAQPRTVGVTMGVSF
jgi:outer membrane receptor protein involved in Fe transport